MDMGELSRLFSNILMVDDDNNATFYDMRTTPTQHPRPPPRTSNARAGTSTATRSKHGMLQPSPEVLALAKECNPPYIVQCDKRCRDCAEHFPNALCAPFSYIAYKGKIGDQAMQQLATLMTKSILKDHEYLKQKLETHGNAILDRWIERSDDSRGDIVKRVDPSRYDGKFPQVDFLYSYLDGSPLQIFDRKYRKAWLLPYLTIDNLCDDKSELLRLLHHRTQHRPADWVLFHSDQSSDAYSSAKTKVTFNTSCVVMYGEEYGKVVPYDKDHMHAWNIVG